MFIQLGLSLINIVVLVSCSIMGVIKYIGFPAPVYDDFPIVFFKDKFDIHFISITVIDEICLLDVSASFTKKGIKNGRIKNSRLAATVGTGHIVVPTYHKIGAPVKLQGYRLISHG